MKVGKLFIILFVLVSAGLSAKSNYGVDLPLYGNLSLVVVPGAFESIEGTGGASFDLGLGMYYNSSNNIKIRGGIHLWNKVFNPTYTGDYTINNYTYDGKMKEEGVLSYTGLYFLVTSEKSSFFWGGGFDLSFATSYEADVSFFDGQNEFLGKLKGNDYSILTDEFNAQFDLLFNMGINVLVSERVTIRPSVMLTIPCIKIFDTNVYAYSFYNDSEEEVGISIFSTKFGINLEYAL